jgi:uncharacterized protein (TIGR02145 family)
MKNLFILTFILAVINTSYSQSPGVTDIDGNTYDTIHYNGYAIMVDLLKVTHFNDGKKIPYVKKNKDFIEASKGRGGYPAYCYYDNKKKNQSEYGNLYNLQCIKDNERLAPKGWHIPSYKEWVKIFGKINYDLRLVPIDHKEYKKKKPKEITKNNRLRWVFDLKGGGARKQYTGEFVFLNVCFVHLIGGSVSIDYKAEADNYLSALNNSYSIICIKKL